MFGPELVLILGICVLACNLWADRLRTPAPILLLVVGILLGFFPALRAVQLPPEAVLFLFLPALLYWESLTTPLRDIRRYQRGIVLMSTALVAATAAAVAVVVHALGLPWGPAWVLGAAIAPTDATAVGALARVLPHRNVTLLRAESLINDGTALVVYGVAESLTVGAEPLDGLEISGMFLLAYAGGIAAGVLTVWAGIKVRRRVRDALPGSVVSILTPFTAFVLAELIGASGVLAVVTAGLGISQSGPGLVPAATRRSLESFWSLSTFMLNGALFVLVGMELQASIRGISGVGELLRGLLAMVVVAAVLVGVRLAFLFLMTSALRTTYRGPLAPRPELGARANVVSALAGFRGAVSLAAVLATPTVLASGAPFPDRGFIIFVATGVIVLTLVVQGPLLPAVVRWAGLPTDAHLYRSERKLAETVASSEALAAMPRTAAHLGIDRDVVAVLRREYQQHLRVLRARGRGDAGTDPAVANQEQYRRLRLALLGQKRATVIRLRNEHRIDDTVLRELQFQLDLEEVRLAPPEAPG
ncbi:Na+/H+ antiporter [Arthrobacter sp. zg-Y411]|uniref:Na+/H+ antiporter n=1 Tax=Arthrobacter zhangbolii TaxID=2886936 RepID=UPI001D135F5A|nr:Na+/H+ antiporter [Arthrobacter zhangbolii]MCC3294332.1 Na+/H+ antiporter [Arthrobacter zhangbolii]